MAGGAANWARALTRAAIVIGTGVVLLKTTTPNEQQMYDNLSPDLKRSVDAQRHAHERAAQSARIREQQSELAAQQDTAKANWLK
ncbi:mitochondrial protein required for assembly of cytochrome bc1 complex [Malassezia restricta]|uniref:Assembly factor CBP4 n=1 Tax=Malassezia restricta (strain ATCC 96810 / NBRC 103918 / CBS 7877) TaxID=425264 RepID=A0A3G2S0H9_MALR7|nr:mitochondrial protein required for assembly of cytochrome bc1 complex [Malassezia restricta]AXA48375.1 mitochondrial protein required for assembly of cytochrome bc1 complex [Malassezia restricta]AYO41029.1 Assembly factor CBP4 [Malassezia restricta CBS 7877]